MASEKACPPHDFGQDEGITLSAMLVRTCPNCGLEAASVFGKMLETDDEEEATPDE